MFKALQLLILAVIWTGFASAQDLRRAEPTDLQREGLTYKIFKKLAVDIDAALKKKNIEIQSCTYQSIFASRSLSYKGLGPCLYENFRDSMKTSTLSGSVFAWGTTPWGDVKPLRIEWRPAVGGWAEYVKISRDMRSESRAVKNKSTELRSKQSLVGNVKIFFSKDFPVQKLALEVAPVQRVDGIMEYEGTLEVTASISQMQQMQQFQSALISWKTNINLFKTKRSFYLRGHGEATGETQ